MEAQDITRLSEAKINHLKNFYRNQEMHDAVKEFLFEGLLTEADLKEVDDAQRNWVYGIAMEGVTDAEYGAKVKRIAQAIKMLQGKFDQIGYICEEPKEKEEETME